MLAKVRNASLFFAAGISILTASCAPAEDRPPIEVLFIGNSYTHGNNLPKMIAFLARAAGERPLKFETSLHGGFMLQKHWDGGTAVEKIRANHWDVVVLQEQSQLPVRKPEVMHRYARKLHGEIDKRGAKTVFFLTWARQHVPKMQDGLNRAYLDVAEELQADVAPAGMAWRAALAADPKLVLHAGDKSHPNKAGTYLTACVFFAAIYDKSPEGLPGITAQLSDGQARQARCQRDNPKDTLETCPTRCRGIRQNRVFSVSGVKLRDASHRPARPVPPRQRLP